MSKKIIAWHFLPNDCKFRHGDGHRAEVGHVYSAKTPLDLCGWGLHASVNIHDALNYAPGHMIGRVVLSGEIIHGDDKLCAARREYMWIADAKQALRDHARWCALQVTESGDAARRAAMDAAWSTAWDTESSAARDASRRSARDAAWAAAFSAAKAAESSAESPAAIAAARKAAFSAARAAQSHDLEQRLFALGAPEAL